MARSLKTRGMDELNLFKRRVNRQLGLGRISVPDADYLLDLINRIEARVTNMRETEGYGKEVEEEW
jgi:hypothetical protein